MTPNLGQRSTLQALPEFLRFGRLDFAITRGFVITCWDLDCAITRRIFNINPKPPNLNPKTLNPKPQTPTRAKCFCTKAEAQPGSEFP